ncbi:hypothetical protein Cgig2_000985 [Carnegiea gigantea]|uniref:Uncharacterized protein n=1 Tax=Carnegiea gigantea TaxID=171969 RepID=A0A9Q1K465_9CARY|nr:hypothetical protein Cgig2_000985 [Carnegiea gigantea]
MQAGVELVRILISVKKMGTMRVNLIFTAKVERGRVKQLWREKYEATFASHSRKTQRKGSFSSKSVKKKRNKVRKKKSSGGSQQEEVQCGRGTVDGGVVGELVRRNNSGRGRRGRGLRSALCHYGSQTVIVCVRGAAGYRVQHWVLIGKGVQGAGGGDIHEQ